MLSNSKTASYEFSFSVSSRHDLCTEKFCNSVCSTGKVFCLLRYDKVKLYLVYIVYGSWAVPVKHCRRLLNK